MDEVIPGLWIGDLPSALDAKNLKIHGIYSILSAMRGRVTINETFIRHQIQLDDAEDADILTHFLPSIHFIQAELAKGRGVLVHCQAGISRSSTIVAAYLMHSKHLNPYAALELIRKARPFIDPNPGFIEQLDIFYKAQYQTSGGEKAVRMFYMERAVGEVMNGDGSLPAADMFAKFPRTPSDSLPPTPGRPRRRIRCKMCRQELAAREHMLDHGQLGPATPAENTPAASRRSSATQTRTPTGPLSNVPAIDPAPRRPSRLSFGSGTGEPLAMSPIGEGSGSVAEKRETPVIPEHPLNDLRSISRSLHDPSMDVSALDTEDDNDNESNGLPRTRTPPPLPIDLSGTAPEDISIEAWELLGRRPSDPFISAPDKNTLEGDKDPSQSNGTDKSSVVEHLTTHLTSPTDLAAQLFTNPKLAGLRSPPSAPTSSHVSNPVPTNSAPIILDPRCSGYFVEPMKWMEHFLSAGQISGKIICPNKKCGAKLGNYDWAGVCCGCKQWVTPGFCINRSKVDEVV